MLIRTSVKPYKMGLAILDIMDMLKTACLLMADNGCLKIVSALKMLILI